MQSNNKAFKERDDSAWKTNVGVKLRNEKTESFRDPIDEMCKAKEPTYEISVSNRSKLRQGFLTNHLKSFEKYRSFEKVIFISKSLSRSSKKMIIYIDEKTEVNPFVDKLTN